MAKTYFIVLVFFCFAFNGIAQNKVIDSPQIQMALHELDSIAKLKVSDSLENYSLNNASAQLIRMDSLNLPNNLESSLDQVDWKIKKIDLIQSLKRDFSFDSIPFSNTVDSVPSFSHQRKIDSIDNSLKSYDLTSLSPTDSLKERLQQLEGIKQVEESQNLKGGFSFDSLPSGVIDGFSIDTLFKAKGRMQELPWEDSNQFQKEFESQFTKEFDGLNIPVEEVNKKQVLAKRVISIKDREIVDSIRSVASDKLYKIKDEVQDSLSVYLIAEKQKLKESMFFEGLVNMETYKGNLSVSDFSGILGVKLNKFYEVGLGPEIGVSGKDFSAIGARVFARRKIFDDKSFAIVENSIRQNPGISEFATNAEGLMSNLKLGAGRLFNLTPSGETKLNVQTLLNPQYLKTGYSNLVDFRLGISKLTFKP